MKVADEIDVDEEEIPILVSMNPSEGRIPVTLLTGFLGAGKSTLINHLLRVNHGKRIAIVENEFSEGLSIEGMIVKSGVADGENINNFFELNNGCICCTVKDNLVSTLEQLVLHKDKFDYILIETTGVANPGPVVSVFWADDNLDTSLRLDGVVCVVDSVNILNYLHTNELVHDVCMQIAYADRILVNKKDLVSQPQIEQVTQAVRRINGIAEIQVTCKSEVGPEWILNINGYSSQTVSRQFFNSYQRLDETLPSHRIQEKSLPQELCQPCLPFQPIASASNTTISGLKESTHTTIHSGNVLSTLSLLVFGEMNLRLLNQFLDNILYCNGQLYNPKLKTENNTLKTRPQHFSDLQALSDSSDESLHKSSMRIFRMKGAICIEGKNTYHLLQAVHDIFEVSPSTFPIEIQDSVSSNSNVDKNNSYNGPLSRIVVIGKCIDRKSLYDGLCQCVVGSP